MGSTELKTCNKLQVVDSSINTQIKCLNDLCGPSLLSFVDLVLKHDYTEVRPTMSEVTAVVMLKKTA